MPFTNQPWYLIISGVLDATWWLFLVANLFYRTAVPGSHQRYVWVSIAWAAAFPALASLLLGMAAAIASNDSLGVALSIILTLLWAFDFHRLRNNGDDNWFKRTGKRLRRWASQHMPSLSPMPHGAGA
jgi:steroid 5-alpha reductase family enzyme